jgi:hypothetical protein
VVNGERRHAEPPGGNDHPQLWGSMATVQTIKTIKFQKSSYHQSGNETHSESMTGQNRRRGGSAEPPQDRQKSKFMLLGFISNDKPGYQSEPKRSRLASVT